MQNIKDKAESKLKADEVRLECLRLCYQKHLLREENLREAEALASFVMDGLCSPTAQKAKPKAKTDVKVRQESSAETP